MDGIKINNFPVKIIKIVFSEVPKITKKNYMSEEEELLDDNSITPYL